MIGMTLTHAQSGITGQVDAVSVDPAGNALARIDDHWFMVAELEAA